MTDSLKVLGQQNPSVTTLTDLYTVPAATETTISTVTVCNRGGSSATFRISVAVDGASDDLSQYIYYDVPIQENDTFASTIGISLASGDVVRCYTDTAVLSFSLFGVEVS